MSEIKFFFGRTEGKKDCFWEFLAFKHDHHEFDAGRPITELISGSSFLIGQHQILGGNFEADDSSDKINCNLACPKLFFCKQLSLVVNK